MTYSPVSDYFFRDDYFWRRDLYAGKRVLIQSTLIKHPENFPPDVFSCKRFYTSEAIALAEMQRPFPSSFIPSVVVAFTETNSGNTVTRADAASAARAV